MRGDECLPRFKLFKCCRHTDCLADLTVVWSILDTQLAAKRHLDCVDPPFNKSATHLVTKCAAQRLFSYLVVVTSRHSWQEAGQVPRQESRVTEGDRGGQMRCKLTDLGASD